MLSKAERVAKLELFRTLCSKASFEEVAPHVYERHGSFSKTVTFSTLIHGNEIGGVEVFLRLLTEIQEKKFSPKTNLRFILGNVEAYYEDKRYIETDMNRSFGLQDPETREELRARELEKFLRSSDVLIDLHQTIGPTSTPFFIFEFHEQSYNLARFLHPTLPIVTNSKQRPFKGKTSTAYIISEGGMGVTVESGQKGINDTQISLGLNILRMALETDFKSSLPACPITNTFTFKQIICDPTKRLELIKKFNNFDEVKKDEVVARSSTEEVKSEVDGVILFPKYGEYAKAASELALILNPVTVREEI